MGAGPIAQITLPGDRTAMVAKLQAAPAAAAPWRSVIGATVPAYQLDGRVCAATVAGLHLLGYGYGDDLDEQDDFGGGVRVLAELTHPPDCAPVLLTNRAPRSRSL